MCVCMCVCTVCVYVRVIQLYDDHHLLYTADCFNRLLLLLFDCSIRVYYKKLHLLISTTLVVPVFYNKTINGLLKLEIMVIFSVG